jgi:hypothetical protein
MPTFEIKNRYTNNVIWKCEADNFKKAIETAVAQNINLEGANLQGVDLRGANLCGANLQGSNLQGANLREANLQGANLRGANLQEATLLEANLQGANLQGANLAEANLYAANLREAKLPSFQIPQRKSLIVYKKLLYGEIATLRIPSRAARTASLSSSSPLMRSEGKFGKCRAERAFVVAIENCTEKSIKRGRSHYNDNFTYEVGKEVKPEENYDPDILIECTSGIHFFMTKEEAKEFY